MEDYTKYRLKSSDELAPLLDGADNIFILACNKCFKEFEVSEEPEREELKVMAEGRGRKVTGTGSVDFLCNRTLTEKKFPGLIPAGTDNIFVISCGVGVQTIADMQGLPVYTASDTVNLDGHHGMALTKKLCGACAQCYLNVTGGICPVVDCSKSLINGQCGGAKNGKCEVDSEKDCAWQKIYERLKAQGRLEEFLNEPVQLRDWSRTDSKKIRELVNSARESRFAGYYGGIHPAEGKQDTEHMGLVRFPDPDIAVIPMSMHMGAPAKPLVGPGDEVKVGQKIGEAAGFISVPVHSSVSGTVIAVEERRHATNGSSLAVVIKSDGKNTPHESVKPGKPLEELSPDEIIEIVKEAGISGMGGAGFPTYVKLMPKKPIEAVLVNGCECEPMLTADHRVLLEYADDVIYGLKAAMKAVAAPRGVIVIEDNKPDAIALMEEKLKGEDGIEVCAARTKYPQGCEKMLIKLVLDRTVPSGGLPADVGAVVDNVSTLKAISDAIRKGMPLIERVTAVTGPYIPNPGNFIVKFGTSAASLVEHCGGVLPGDVVIKAGGPMMGFVQKDLEFPIMKSSNGIIAIENDHTETLECIKCGRCVDVCPMQLSPMKFGKCADKEDWLEMKALNVMDCMECRSCEAICSSKIPLLSKIKTGKAAVKGMK